MEKTTVIGMGLLFAQSFPGVTTDRCVRLTAAGQACSYGYQYGNDNKQFAYYVAVSVSSGITQITIPVEKYTNVECKR